MKQENGQISLSVRERWQVLGIATGFLLVLALLAWLAITYAAPATILDGIPEYFRAGKIRSALGLCVTLVFYVVGLPLGIVVSLLSIFQGASGRRTGLTRWLLREMSEPGAQDGSEPVLKSLDAKTDDTDGVLNRYLPKAIGWAILVGIVVVAFGILIWAAIDE
jgi:hypothetical protein